MVAVAILVKRNVFAWSRSGVNVSVALTKGDVFMPVDVAVEKMNVNFHFRNDAVPMYVDRDAVMVFIKRLSN